MAPLHNRVSQKELKQRLLQETEHRTTISFYQYFPIADPQAFRDELYLSLNALNVFGRIYVAHEGINAQINVPDSKLRGPQKLLLFHKNRYPAFWLKIAVDDNRKSFLGS